MIKLKPVLINLDSRAQLLIIGIIVGICSGFAALGLNLLLEIVSHFLHQFHDKLYTVLFPGFGILLTVIYLKYIVRDFGGHGVPEVIYGVSLKGGVLKLRSVVSKLIGSLSGYAYYFLLTALFPGTQFSGPNLFALTGMAGILNKFGATSSWSLPVVENGEFLGLISKATILDHYRKELKAQTES